MSAHAPLPQGPPRFLGMLFGFVFAGIGVTVLGFLWSLDGFGAPPLFFKIFGSFIALAFVGVGGGLFYSAFKNKPRDASAFSSANAGSMALGKNYSCPSCGSRLGAQSEVSPKGDVKCSYCAKWFNIHG